MPLCTGVPNSLIMIMWSKKVIDVSDFCSTGFHKLVRMAPTIVHLSLQRASWVYLPEGSNQVKALPIL